MLGFLLFPQLGDPTNFSDPNHTWGSRFWASTKTNRTAVPDTASLESKCSNPWRLNLSYLSKKKHIILFRMISTRFPRFLAVILVWPFYILSASMLVSSQKIYVMYMWLLEIPFIGKPFTRKDSRAPPTGSIIKFFAPKEHNNYRMIFKRFFIVEVYMFEAYSSTLNTGK